MANTCQPVSFFLENICELPFYMGYQMFFIIQAKIFDLGNAIYFKFAKLKS